VFAGKGKVTSSSCEEVLKGCVWFFGQHPSVDCSSEDAPVFLVSIPLLIVQVNPSAGDLADALPAMVD
jgi:hypothetical protein